MEYRIRKNVDLIITHINNIRLGNTSKNYINELEFEFRDKYRTYKTDEFKQLLDEYCSKNNISYIMHEHPLGDRVRLKMSIKL